MKSEALLLNACLRIRVEDISHFVCRLRLGFNPPRLSPTSLTIFFSFSHFLPTFSFSAFVLENLVEILFSSL